MTASRSVQAPQFEVLLKVKQSNNEEFGFLSPSHPHHQYYSFLKWRVVKENKSARKLKETCDEINDSESSAHEDKEGKGVVEGLLSMYSSSEDEVDHDLETEYPQTDVLDEKNKITNGKGLLSMYSSSEDEVDHDLETEYPQTGVLDEKNKITNSTGTCFISSPEKERQAKRLKRAQMMKHCFEQKMRRPRCK